jgi:LysM repeat protein
MPSVEPAPPPFLAGRDRSAAPIAAIGTIPPATPPYTPQASVGQPVDGSSGRDQARRVPVKKVDPDWIRSGRREAYPKLRTRIGLRHIPVAVALIAGIGIVVVSLVLLAGFLGKGTTNLPTSRPSGSPTPTAAPTPTPSPSPLTYTVKSGDALEAIAKDFGLTVDQVACANGITDPNLLQVGQVLVIPDDEFQCPGASPESTDSE